MIEIPEKLGVLDKGAEEENVEFKTPQKKISNFGKCELTSNSNSI